MAKRYGLALRGLTIWIIVAWGVGPQSTTAETATGSDASDYAFQVDVPEPQFLAHQDGSSKIEIEGFGTTERLDWIMTMRDMAGWYLEVLDDLGLEQIPLLGYGLGGWLAAEMAVMCPQQFDKLVLVAAPGIRPPTGEIFDMFRVMAREYLATSIFDPEQTSEYQELYGGEITADQLDVWEYAREEASRLTWRPYMHYPGLAPLLHRLKRLPTLIIWGREDPIIPVSAGEAYQAAIPGSRLVVLDRCGHHPEMEQTEAFVRCVQDFLYEA